MKKIVRALLAAAILLAALASDDLRVRGRTPMPTPTVLPIKVASLKSLRLWVGESAFRVRIAEAFVEAVGNRDIVPLSTDACSDTRTLARIMAGYP